MPQPLSKVHPKATVQLGFANPIALPDFAIIALKVIRTWAATDLVLSHMATRFLRSDFETVAAMFQAIVSTEARRDALLAAADHALPRNDFNLLRAVFKATKPSRDRRNEFAHHLWGVSPEVPDAFLLAAPEALNDFMVDVSRDLSAIMQGMKPKIIKAAYDHSKILVYRQLDVEREATAAENAYGWFMNLYMLIGVPAPGRGAMRAELLNQPLVRQPYEKFCREDGQPPPPGLPE